MRQIQLDDRLYEQAARRAMESGYRSVEEYVADVVACDLVQISADLDDFFTPDRLAEIDIAAEQIASGNFLTADEVDEHFKKRFSG